MAIVKIGKTRTPLVKWRELPPWGRVARTIWIMSWVVGATSLVAMGAIQMMALSQPLIPDSYFSHPHIIKGETRYFSDLQERIFAVSKPLLFGSIAMFLILGILEQRLAERRDAERTQRMLQRFDESFGDQDSKE